MTIWKLSAATAAAVVAMVAATSAPLTTVQLQKFGRVYTNVGLRSYFGAGHRPLFRKDRHGFNVATSSTASRMQHGTRRPRAMVPRTFEAPIR